MRSRPLASVISLVALGLLTSSRTPIQSASQPASQAQTQPKDPQPPTFHTEANYVRVDVYPTKNAAPVVDLTKDDFEVLEGGSRQTIEQFEHVMVRGSTPQAALVEPNTVRESRAMLENSRARVFVFFLDVYHVDVGGSHNIRQPLVEALDRMVGPEDLVGVMTPEMSPTDIAFARKTTTIEGFLGRYWTWGERDSAIHKDPEDDAYVRCYPNQPGSSLCADQNGIAAEMLDRRHEKRVLDALRDLVIFLRGVREERKAVLAITNGWLLFRPDQSLMRPLDCGGIPTGPSVKIDPRNGRPTTRDIDPSVPSSVCDRDRMLLAQIDDDQEFREILDEANRANASFYPIDPRGLTAFDTPIVRQDVPGPPPPPLPPSVDQRMLQTRLTSLRTLAEATDGLAIVDTNNLSRGLRRVVDDLSSYYLLGYYSSGKLDGKFHSISVRVKRPGVQVRARRGYLAATPVVTRARAGNGFVATPAPAPDPEAIAVRAAVGSMMDYTHEVPLRLQLAAGWTPGGRARVWTSGELKGDDWTAGADVEAALTNAEGATMATARAAVPIGARSFRLALEPTDPLAPGSYSIRVLMHSSGSSTVATQTGDINLPASPASAGAIWIRRGPSTANRDQPTADLRFRRSEHLRIELPTSAESAGSARLLDRVGHPFPVPVAVAVRTDPDGSRWRTAQVSLAPLGAGDYVIEMTDGADRTFLAFRVVP